MGKQFISFITFELLPTSSKSKYIMFFGPRKSTKMLPAHCSFVFLVMFGFLRIFFATDENQRHCLEHCHPAFNGGDTVESMLTKFVACRNWR
jgi:hypothetical protein